MISLQVGQKAYYDTFSGLILCMVLSLTGKAHRPTSSIKVEFKLLEDRGAYKKGEILSSSSLWVCPIKSIKKTKYGCTIRHYTVGQ